MTVAPRAAPVTRSGAASENGSVASPAWSTSYSLANAVTSAAPLTRTRTTGDPVTWSRAASGAEVKAALCPGMLTDTPPSPGSTDMDGGAPPGGFSTVCARPASGSTACLVPPRPG